MTTLTYWLQAAAWVLIMLIVGGLAGAAVTKRRDR